MAAEAVTIYFKLEDIQLQAYQVTLLTVRSFEKRLAQ